MKFDRSMKCDLDPVSSTGLLRAQKVPFAGRKTERGSFAVAKHSAARRARLVLGFAGLEFLIDIGLTAVTEKTILGRFSSVRIGIGATTRLSAALPA